MTKNATEFITPLTLSTLSKNKVIVDTKEHNAILLDKNGNKEYARDNVEIAGKIIEKIFDI